jgi:hypothetical protein
MSRLIVPKDLTYTTHRRFTLAAKEWAGRYDDVHIEEWWFGELRSGYRERPVRVPVLHIVVGDPGAELHELAVPMMHTDERAGLAQASLEIPWLAQYPQARKGVAVHYLVGEGPFGNPNEHAGSDPTIVDHFDNFWRTQSRFHLPGRGFPARFGIQGDAISQAIQRVAIELKDKEQRLTSYRPLHNAHVMHGIYWAYGDASERHVALARRVEARQRRSLPLFEGCPESPSVKLPNTRASVHYPYEFGTFINDCGWLSREHPGLITGHPEIPRWAPRGWSHERTRGIQRREDAIDVGMSTMRPWIDACRPARSLLLDVWMADQLHEYDLQAAWSWCDWIHSPYEHTNLPDRLSPSESFEVVCTIPFWIACRIGLLARSLGSLPRDRKVEHRADIDRAYMAADLARAWVQEAPRRFELQTVPISTLVDEALVHGTYVREAGRASALDIEPNLSGLELMAH